MSMKDLLELAQTDLSFLLPILSNAMLNHPVMLQVSAVQQQQEQQGAGGAPPHGELMQTQQDAGHSPQDKEDGPFVSRQQKDDYEDTFEDTRRLPVALTKVTGESAQAQGMRQLLDAVANNRVKLLTQGDIIGM